MIREDHEDSEKSLKRKSPNALSATERKGGGDPEQYAPDATRGCMENASSKHMCYLQKVCMHCFT
jgi:hypothetical protein